MDTVFILSVFKAISKNGNWYKSSTYNTRNMIGKDATGHHTDSVMQSSKPKCEIQSDTHANSQLL